ncbi:hypothetical protein [Burkholderia plantarii]|uniref:hypothetical protein n=1 Tax=Burkholderia plantarii TaxID=41899 RepID=UPI0008707899|nr:hypothetical protein [Burkholderia plantarii]
MPLPPVSDFDIAREFRLQRTPGSAVDAITNPAVRRALEAGARARAARESSDPARHLVDAKSRAANDFS